MRELSGVTWPKALTATFTSDEVQQKGSCGYGSQPALVRAVTVRLRTCRVFSLVHVSSLAVAAGVSGESPPLAI